MRRIRRIGQIKLIGLIGEIMAQNLRMCSFSRAPTSLRSPTSKKERILAAHTMYLVRHDSPITSPKIKNSFFLDDIFRYFLAYFKKILYLCTRLS